MVFRRTINHHGRQLDRSGNELARSAQSTVVLAVLRNTDSARRVWEHKAKRLAEGLAGCPFEFPDSEDGPLWKCSFHR